jgi:RNA recognition motif-containing protein
MAFFAMAAAFGANLPGMPPFPGTQGNNQNQQGPKRRCRDYHDRGFCAQGMFCPYKHGDAVAEVPEYDPEKSHLAVQSRNQRQYKSSSRSFPNTKLIVEQIPEEHLNEEAVRDYFAQFGNIAHVQVHIYKGLAVVEFEDRAAAEQAWHCPKAVFDNRFVKVFWYKPERLGELAYDDAPMDDVDDGHEKLDFEEIAKRQAEAQKAFEERRRKKAEAAARAAEVEKLLKEKNDEIEQIKRQLAELSKDEADEFSQSLATLQAEAEDLFAQHDPAAPSDADRGAFRGGYRGRGSFPPRGRGAYRGRGGFGNASRFAMKKLDNRPRRLAVSNIQADSPRDEALRQHLLVSIPCVACYHQSNSPYRTSPTAHPSSATPNNPTPSSSPSTSATKLKRYSPILPIYMAKF